MISLGSATFLNKVRNALSKGHNVASTKKSISCPCQTKTWVQVEKRLTIAKS